MKTAPYLLQGAIFIPIFDRPDVVKLRGAADATSVKKRSEERNCMKREDIIALGIEDKDVLDKILALNGADIEKQKTAAIALTTERDNYKAQLEAANQQIEQFKGLNVEQIQQAADDWKRKYETAEADYQSQLAARDYDAAALAAIADVKFTSKAAKTAFLAQLKEKQLKLENGSLVGFADVLEQAKADDPSAFASDKPAPKFTDPITGAPLPEITKEAFAKMSYMEKVTLKTERPEIYKGLTQ